MMTAPLYLELHVRISLLGPCNNDAQYVMRVGKYSNEMSKSDQGKFIDSMTNADGVNVH
jgi:hypothetical protein